jgi:acyl carrier protein
MPSITSPSTRKAASNLGQGFLDDLGANSLAGVDLVMVFGVEVPHQDAEKIRKFHFVKDGTDHICKHRKGGN